MRAPSANAPCLIERSLICANPFAGSWGQGLPGVRQLAAELGRVNGRGPKCSGVTDDSLPSGKPVRIRYSDPTLSSKPVLPFARHLNCNGSGGVSFTSELGVGAATV